MVSIAMEIGPQPHASIRSNIFVAMQEGVELMLEWIHLFNSGTETSPRIICLLFLAVIDRKKEKKSQLAYHYYNTEN